MTDMKNIIRYLSIFILLMSIAAPCLAQLKVSSVQQICESGTQPQLSPAGDYVLVHDAGVAGLTRVEVATGEKAVVVPDANIDGEVVFSDGGTMIAYRTTSYDNHIRYNTIKAANLKTGEVKDLDKPARETYAFRFAGGKMKIGKRTTVRSQRLLTDIRKIEHEYVLAVEEDDLVLYDGTKRKVLNPNGKNIYIWQHISPDEKHIVYVAVNDGCHTFVCDINGQNIVDLGHYIGAPTWFGNDWIIGQQDEDDGHQMTASRLVAIRPDGKDFQILPTPQQKLPINPNASTDGKVVFENNNQIFLMQLQ